ncbi:MAG TPA: RHS repeat domain-containing protein, partial [Casimicrobiaceae bacterium]
MHYRERLLAATRPADGPEQQRDAIHVTYNGLGDNTQLASPDTGTSSYTYDKASNTLTKVDARGKTATFSYDALSRVAQVTFADGQGVTQTYDVAPNGVGRLASMTD